MDKHPIQEGVEILLLVSCYSNRDKLWLDGPLGMYADFTLPTPRGRVGGGDFPIKRMGLCLSNILKKALTVRGTKILFCGHGLKFFHPQEVQILKQHLD